MSTLNMHAPPWQRSKTVSQAERTQQNKLLQLQITAFELQCLKTRENDIF